MPTGRSPAPSAPSGFPLRGWAPSRPCASRAGPLGPAARPCPSHTSAQARARRERHNGAHRPSPHRPSIDLGSRGLLPRGPPGRPHASGTHSRLPHRASLQSSGVMASSPAQAAPPKAAPRRSTLEASGTLPCLPDRASREALMEGHFAACCTRSRCTGGCTRHEDSSAGRRVRRI